MSTAPTSAYSATDGAAYQVFLGRWTERLAEALLDVVEFPDSGALIDVGCGTGSLALAMARRWPGRPINAIDIAEPYIAFARARAVATYPNFDVADAIAIPHPDGQFVGSTAQLVLNFVSDAYA